MAVGACFWWATRQQRDKLKGIKLKCPLSCVLITSSPAHSLTHSLASWLPHSLLKSLWQWKCRLSSDASRRILKSATAPTKPESEQAKSELKLESQSQPETVAKTSEHQRKRERRRESLAFSWPQTQKLPKFCGSTSEAKLPYKPKEETKEIFFEFFMEKNTIRNLLKLSRMLMHICTIYFKYFDLL